MSISGKKLTSGKIMRFGLAIMALAGILLMIITAVGYPITDDIKLIIRCLAGSAFLLEIFALLKKITSKE